MEELLHCPKQEVNSEKVSSKAEKSPDSDNVQEYTYSTRKILTDDEKHLLEKQNSRLVTEFKSMKIESESKKHWDLFYKRNENRFFKDRHWTTREFVELIGNGDRKSMLEIGCGVGNLIFPLINETEWIFYACDLSPRAVELVKKNPLYNESRIKVFQADISVEYCFSHSILKEVDVCTLVFVLSAIHPEKFPTVFKNVFNCLKPGGYLLFRDYGLYDMAQLRFKPGHKISENLYLRQDGTRSYFFSVEELTKLAVACGFQVVDNCYVHRRTINVKENVDVPRIFIQAKLMKPDVDSIT